MAPEQLAARKLTRTADVYAMGVVLWEMLACRRLFDGDDEAELMGALMAGAKEPPSVHAQGLSPALDALVMKALAPEPAERFATAREMADELALLIPPAAPTDVGAWCAEVAKDSLSKRAAAVAEIESNGAASSPFATGGNGDRAEVSSQPGRSKSRPAAVEAGHDDEVAPTIASQPASTALGTPPPAAHPQPRRALLAAVAGALLLLAFLGVAHWAPWSPGPEAVEPAGSSLGAIGAGATTPPPPEPTQAVPALLSAPDPSSSAAPAASDTTAPPPAAPRATPPHSPGSTATPAPPRPAGTCNPPYVFDSHGNKKWKRQCL